MGVVGPSPVRRRTILVEALRRRDRRSFLAVSNSPMTGAVSDRHDPEGMEPLG